MKKLIFLLLSSIACFASAQLIEIKIFNIVLQPGLTDLETQTCVTQICDLSTHVNEYSCNYLSHVGIVTAELETKYASQIAKFTCVSSIEEDQMYGHDSYP